MSNSQNSSSSATAAQRNNDQLGIPNTCSLCGNRVSLKTSKSETNPKRRYYRCDLASDMKLANDNHLFKWLDDALLEEVTILSDKNRALTKDVLDLFKLFEDVSLSVQDDLRKNKAALIMLASVWIATVIVLKGT